MTLNLSQTSAAIAARKHELMHHEENAEAKLKWLRDPKNHEHMKMLQKAWIAQNELYYREYMRLSNAISYAHKKGDCARENELRIQRKLHQATLPNRKTMGRIVK